MAFVALCDLRSTKLYQGVSCVQNVIRSWNRRKCDFLYAHEKNMTFSVLILTKLTGFL